MLRYATPLVVRGDRRHVLASARGVVNIGLEGMMLMGAFFGDLGRRRSPARGRSGSRSRSLAGAAAGAASTRSSAIHLRADQIVGGTAINFLALGITGYLFVDDLRAAGHADRHVDRSRTSTSASSSDIPGDRQLPGRRLRPPEPDDLARASCSSSSYCRHLQDADRPAHPRGRRAPARGGHGRDQRLRDPLRRGHPLGHARGRSAARTSRSASSNSFNENMTAGRGFIALAALIFGNWRPFGACGRVPPLRLLERARATACQTYSTSAVDALPGAAVRAHADRRRRRDRPLDPAGRRLAARTSSSSVRPARVRRRVGVARSPDSRVSSRSPSPST